MSHEPAIKALGERIVALDAARKVKRQDYNEALQAAKETREQMLAIDAQIGELRTSIRALGGEA